MMKTTYREEYEFTIDELKLALMAHLGIDLPPSEACLSTSIVMSTPTAKLRSVTLGIERSKIVKEGADDGGKSETKPMEVPDPVCERPLCRHRRSQHSCRSLGGDLRCSVEGCPCGAGRDAWGLWQLQE